METFDDTSDFGCKTICLVRTNGDLYYETDKSERQKTIINELVKDKFECEYRGEMEVKGKGQMAMYYVS